MTYRGYTLPFSPLSRNAELGLEAPINSSGDAVCAWQQGCVLIMSWMFVLDRREDVAFCRQDGHRGRSFNIFDVAPDASAVFVELKFVNRRWDPAGSDVFKARFFVMAEPGSEPRIARVPWTLDDVRRMTRLVDLVVERRDEVVAWYPERARKVAW